ncbi:MAG: hypothetical protein CNLJKLNK_00543 [Holosporales bacterium]
MIKNFLTLIFLIKILNSSACSTDFFSDEESLGTFFSICAVDMNETSRSTRSSLQSESEEENDHASSIFDMISLDAIRDCMPEKYNELMPQIQYAYDDVLHKISKKGREDIASLKNILTKVVLLKTLKHECSRIIAYSQNELDDADYILMEMEHKRNLFNREKIQKLEEKLGDSIQIYSILYNFTHNKVFILFDERKIRNHSRLLAKGLRLSTMWTTKYVFNSVLGAPLIEHIAKISENKKVCQSLKEWLIILCNQIINDAAKYYNQTVFWKNEELFKNHIIFGELFDTLNKYRVFQIKARFDRALNTYKYENQQKIIEKDPPKQAGLLAAAVQWYHTLPRKRKTLMGLMLITDTQRMEKIIELYTQSTSIKTKR